MQARIGESEKEILDLTARIADLKARKTESRGVSAGWELADQKSVILFLEDVSGEARRLGVNLVAVHPTQEIDKEKYKEVSLNLDLRGRYRELAEYFKRLESLSKVVNVRKIRLESCPDSSSVCSAHVEAVTYMAK
jgi:Tfp pilus assembly protein PilO